MLAPHSLEEDNVKELISVLLAWINDTLEDRRIVVRDIVEDIYDGQVLGELLGEWADVCRVGVHRIFKSVGNFFIINLTYKCASVCVACKLGLSQWFNPQ